MSESHDIFYTMKLTQVVATRRNTKIVSGRIVFADFDLAVQCAEEHHGEYKQSNREDDENVVDVETGVAVIEGQESIHRQLSTKVVVFTRQHLFSHTGTDLGLEIENCAETQITTLYKASDMRRGSGRAAHLSALVVFCVLDTTATSESIHTSVNVLVQMQTLLGL